MPTFFWILVYIAILAAVSLTVRWLLLRSMRRRSRGDKHPKHGGEGKD